MNTKILASALLELLFGSGSAFAAEGMVTIFSPPDGATFGSGDRIVLKYDAAHVYLGRGIARLAGKEVLGSSRSENLMGRLLPSFSMTL